MTSWVENEGNGYITRMDKTISEILVGAIERMARVAVNVLTILAPDCTIVFGSMFEIQVYISFYTVLHKI